MKGGRPGEMRSAGKSAILCDNKLPNIRRQGTQAFKTLCVRAFPLTIQNFSRTRDKTCSLPPCPVFSWISLMINSAMWESAGMMTGCFRSVLRGAFPIRPPTLKTPSIRNGFNEANLPVVNNRSDLPVWSKLTSLGNENFWTHWTITISDLLRSEALRGIDLGSGPTWCDAECLRPRRARLSKATNRLSRYQSEKWERTPCKILVEVFRRETEAIELSWLQGLLHRLQKPLAGMANDLLTPTEILVHASTYHKQQELHPQDLGKHRQRDWCLLVHKTTEMEMNSHGS